MLVQRGTLRTGDIVVAGAEWGRVRALINDLGASVKEAGPSVPVEVLGFNGTPEAGDRVAVVENEARAREITDYRTRQKRERQAARIGSAGRSLADMMRDLKDGAGRKEFPLVVKGDVQGSVEAIVGALEKLGNDEVAAPHHPFRRRRHHRIRRHARGGLRRRSSSASTCAPTRKRARRPSGPASRSATTTSSTTSWMT